MTRSHRPLLTLAATIVAACSGGDKVTEPQTPVVTTVQVTASAAAILIGDTAVATATVRDQNGAVMAGQTINWSVTMSGGAATITNAGVLTATAAGTASVTATVSGKTGSASVAVGTDDRFGYAWADEEATATYPPDQDYAYNSSGGGITIIRSSPGVYAVRFEGLGATGAQRTNVQVSSYNSGSNHCKTAGWSSSGSELTVQVRCFAASGAAADARYTVLVTGATALGGRLGFAYADNAAASAAPSQTRSSRSGGIRVERTSLGRYTVTFDGLVRLAADAPEMTMVTAVGDGSERCLVQNWANSNLSVQVLCVGPTGTAVDSKFSLLVLEQGRPGHKLGFAWTHDPTSPSYEPNAAYRRNDGGGTITAERSAPGVYQVTWQGFSRTTGATETFLVAAYGGSGFCRIGSWGGTISVSVYCYDGSGVPADSRFNVLVVQ